MELADARFGEVKDTADFFHGQLLVVVEEDDESFAFGESLEDGLLEDIAGDDTLGIGGSGILILRGHGLIVCERGGCGEGEKYWGSGVSQDRMLLSWSDGELAGDFLIGWISAGLGAVFFSYFGEYFCDIADAAWDPIEFAHSIDDGSGDSAGDVVFERGSPLDVECFDGLDEPENAEADQVIALDARWEPNVEFGGV